MTTDEFLKLAGIDVTGLGTWTKKCVDYASKFDFVNLFKTFWGGLFNLIVF